MELTRLEADLLGDMAQDEHALFEVFHFVRLHYPEADDAEVLRRGRALVAAWLERDWLAISPAAGEAAIPADASLLGVIDQHGVAGTYGYDDPVRLVPGPGAYRDVAWIRAAV